MRMKSPRGPRLTLAVVNIAILVGATLAIQSQASDDFKPSSWFSLTSEPEFTLPATKSGGSSSAALPSPKTSRSGDHSPAPAASASSARAEAALSEPRDSKDEQLWYSESPWPFASSDFGLGDVSSWPTQGDNLSLSAPLATAGGGSASRGRYAGGIGGGGSASSAGGGGIGPQSSPTSSAPSENSKAGLRSSSNGPIASAAGNPFVEGAGTPGGASFPLAQFPGNGPANASGLAFGLPTNFPSAASSLAANVTGAGGVTTLQQPVSVPEPSSLLLLGGALALAASRRRRRPDSRS